MRRRTLLATAGAGLAGLAGCLNLENPGGDAEPSTGTPTTEAGDEPQTSPPDGTTPVDEPTTTDEQGVNADVTVQSVQLQYGVVVPNSPDSIGISNPRTPYVVALVAVDGDLSSSDFTLAIGDESYDSTTLDRFYRTGWGEYQWYERGRPGGLLLFELSTDDHRGDLGLTWPGGRRSIDSSILDRLDAGAPRFSVSLLVPETHDSPDAPRVDIEVTNEGDRARRFLGALNRSGPYIAYAPVARVSEMVPPGETVTLTVDDEWSGMPSDERIGDGKPDVTYRLHYADDEAVAEVRIVESA